MSNLFSSSNDVKVEKAKAELPLTLVIYGEESNIQKAQKQLQLLCDEKFPERTIIHESLQHLTIQDVRQILECHPY